MPTIYNALLINFLFVLAIGFRLLIALGKSEKFTPMNHSIPPNSHGAARRQRLNRRFFGV
jgi:hypothetical protein